MTYGQAREGFTLRILALELRVPATIGPFPWDDFCAVNPGLKEKALEFFEDTGYELSEYQCSYAVMSYRARTRAGR
jgi:hypothetical protein